MLSSIVQLITSGVNAWLERSKQKSQIKAMELDQQFRLKQAKTESQIKRLETADQSDISLDQLSFEHRGWKDDYLLLITTAPVLVLFIAPVLELILMFDSYQHGDLTQAIMDGFTALETTPDWYLIALLLIFVDTLGFRRVLRGVIENKLGQLKRG